ncbi:oligopeptide ABC transporter ATP-binding protein OppD [Spiroplasma chrysopicola]|uniref:Oligopeptide ABC transporter ATP-binding protein n=1 Tax=Spiroplasma chrysopicola DF-1 TaxID=1276227 RepID=R4UAQ1_9MOLU|nr:oligopeptide ABC transporter ATP-binding protein OppD [Spiroplasma chrysopicola]AGM24989.1 oligopeptide ABC transporter ATP-binding protein [Spiroplasma chrysopicola DF-1]
MSNEVIISIKDLVINFKTRANILTAIRNISFDIYDGETLAIVGESGSGKSVMTKTFTNMLEKNGWINSGEIIYYPSQNSLADQNTYFRKPVDLVEFSKISLENNLIKTILKYNRRLIKSLNHQITDFNKMTIANLDAKILQLTTTIKELKAKIDFKASHKLAKIITACEVELDKFTNFKIILTDQEKYDQAIKRLQQKIALAEAEIKKVLRLNLKDRIFLKSNLKILKNYLENNQKIKASHQQRISRYFAKKQFTTPFLEKVQQFNIEMFNGQELATQNFNDLLEQWEPIKSFDFINKKRLAKQITKLRGQTIATIFQDPMTSLNPLLSVGFQISEVIRKHRKLNRAQAKQEAILLLEKVGIKNAKKRYHDIPGMYSGGMRQRVVIAIALACQPKILICDEPTTALDVTIQAQILDLIKELQKEYKFTIIFITHDLGVVATIADRVAVMYAGQIIEYGKVDELFFDSRHPYTWALLSSLPQFGAKGEELYSIPGSPPSLYTKVVGDPFAPRNKYAMKIDYLIEPPMFEVTPSHYAKTWLLDSRAPKVARPKQLKDLDNIIQND